MKQVFETNLGPRIRIIRREIDIGDSEPGFPDLQDINLKVAADFEDEKSDDHYYTNPERSIRAPCDLPETAFLMEAERACGQWMQRLRKTFGRGRIDRMIRSLDHAQRLLVASGVLYLHGRLVHTKRLNWRAYSQKAPR